MSADRDQAFYIANEAAVQMTQIAEMLRNGADPQLVAAQADANSATLMTALEAAR